MTENFQPDSTEHLPRLHNRLWSSSHRRNNYSSSVHPNGAVTKKPRKAWHIRETHSFHDRYPTKEHSTNITSPNPAPSCAIVRFDGMTQPPPTLQEIIQLTGQELDIQPESDSIRECGRAAIALLRTDPATCVQLAYQKLHDVPYKEVKECWRRLYIDATLQKILRIVGNKQSHLGGWIDEAVKELDMALILTGVPLREELVELWFAALKDVLPAEASAKANGGHESDTERPPKRRKTSPSSGTFPSTFPTTFSGPKPILKRPIPRAKEPGLSSFQTKLSNTTTHTPVIIEDAITHWPALSNRPWTSPSYLLSQTLGGRRLVPIEIGKTYTDTAWSQKVVSFKSFLETYMFSSPNETGYLAQHDLFAQVPALRADISIPDYCFCEPAPSPHLLHVKPTVKLEEPLLNAWFGPAGTVSPLHTDPYHNILAQVVGYKYVRLYPPEETSKMFPRSVDENGIDMSNTSEVDLDAVMRVWREISCWGQDIMSGEDLSAEEKDEFRGAFQGFENAKYLEGILGPGECLYLPVGWWHYVRSLTGSFSVSFWFN